ncbi:MAG: hypothetical protein HYT80_04255 [Euryarchaeota archaeon]|nr:hypothetical protein [Euryarchaeota archaeon]
MRPLAVTALTLTPLLVPVAFGAFLAANCEDDWCPGALLELGVELVVAAAVIASAQWILAAHGLPAWRAALAAWTLAFGLAAFVFAASQAYERDWMPALAAVWTAAGLLVGSFVLGARRRPTAAP